MMKMYTKTRGILIGAIVLISAILRVTAVASAVTTIYVPEGGNQTIQQAVNNASAGDTIIVRDGTYTENVDVDVNNVTIRSENGSANCVVNALNTNDPVFDVTADWVNISGFTVRDATGALGIYLNTVDHCTISENNASNNNRGIYLQYSNNNILTGNTANSNNGNGIYLGFSSTNTLTNNTASNNDEYGINLYLSSTNTLTGNTANSNNYNGILLGFSSTNTLTGNTASYNYGGILLSSSNNTLTHNTANSNDYFGIRLSSSSNNTLTHNTANSNNNIGISLYSSSTYNTLTNNTASNNNYGIYLYSSSTNNLSNNTASNNTDRGIYLRESSNNNTLTHNTASNNNIGIYLRDSSTNNYLTNNTANANNGGYGICLDSSSTNTIYNNYFNNTNNAYDDGNNVWNISQTPGTNIVGGPNLGGNYWSDYTGNDTDDDGLGDTPYDIPPGGTNNDYLPLVAIAAPQMFDTGQGTYPSIMGTHNGTITPSCTITVSTVYTYPCAGTGGHAEYVAFSNATTGEEIANGTWNGYVGDWHNITLSSEVTLLKDHEYRYVITTGSYPQVIHASSKAVTGGTITCEEFTDVNGRTYTNWIPTMRLE